MTFRISRRRPIRNFPSPLSRHRRRWRHRRARDALSQPRRRPAAGDLRRAIGRCRRRRRRGVGARRPALANDGRGRHHGVVRASSGAAADRGAARERLHRENAAGKSARRAGHLLSRPVPRPCRIPGSRASRSLGRFRTAPADRRDVSFVWGGDVAGQGWGINPDDGGMFTFATMRKHRPDFLLHSGDTIYADGRSRREVTLADGKVWKNVTIPEKTKVAETLDEFRAAHKYNFLDEQCARLQRRGADLRAMGRSRSHQQLVGVEAASRRLQGTRHHACSPPARRARSTKCIRCARASPSPGRIYRTLNYGPHLDVFMLDERSYRGPNGPNQQTAYGPESYFLGPDQLAWLKRALLNSRATWKVIASDMPLSHHRL